MTRLTTRLHLIFGIAGLAGVLASGCGDDDGGGGGSGTGGDAGNPAVGGNKSTGGAKSGTGGNKAAQAGDTGVAGDDGEGGAAPTGGKGAGTAGEDGEGGEPSGSGGTGGSPVTPPEGGAPPIPSEADVDDVVTSVCDWEFRCCDDGERTYRLSPFSTDAAECAERLIFEMRESNNVNNPYLTGPAAMGGLLGQLGYVVDLERVEVNEEGAAECVAHWSQLDCTEEPDANARCSGPAGSNPCALTNLFTPILEPGDECTEALTETGAANDVECVVGSTCLPAGHADNPNDFATCVSRRLDGEPCTDDDDCDFNLFCNADGDCEEKADVDEVCSYQDPDDPVPGEEEIRCKAGLSCHPVDFKCVAPCTLGFTCAVNSGDADAACPEDSGCAPIEVNESEATFRVCTALGDTAPDLCNSDADCVEGSHCETRVCEQDRIAPTACTAQNQCGDGYYCDIAGTGQCAAHLAPMTVCTDSVQCGPSSAGCLNTGAGGLICRNALLANGAECGAAAACASGKCEVANTTAGTTMTCIVGAEVGDTCDADTANGNAQSCRAGYGCIGGECVEQVGPGGDCSPTVGSPNAALCANGSVCEDPWDRGETCTDQAIPETNGGTGLVCDGN